MTTVEDLIALPIGAVVLAIHPRWQGVGVAAIRSQLHDGEPVWEATGESRPYTSAELVGAMGGADFAVLAPHRASKGDAS